MTENNLRNKVLQGLGWSFIDAFAQRGIRFVFGIILARLLMPEEFGLMGMLTIFIMVAQTFVDGGFALSLIQKKDITEEDKSSIFFLNLFISILMVSCLYLIAPVAADFLEQPMLKPLLRVMSVVIILNGFFVVQNALLIKAIDFKTQTKNTIIAITISGIIGVICAMSGLGVWSLVIQQILTSLIITILLWFRKIWRPTFQFSLSSIKELSGFGLKMLASGLLTTFFDNIYMVVIGKLFSPALLGFYTRANQFQQLPSKTLSRLVSRVTVPAFSSINKEPERVKKAVEKAVKTLALVNFPIMIGLATVAKPLVLVLLTDKWLPCVIYLQILCFVGLLEPFQFINLNVLIAFGKSGLHLRLEIIKKILIVINIFIGWEFGILPMIYGQVVIAVISYFLNSYNNKKIINYSFFSQVKDLFPYLISSVVMGGVVFLMNFLVIKSMFLLLILQIFGGLAVYFGICYLFKFSAFTGMIKILKGKFITVK